MEKNHENPNQSMLLIIRFDGLALNISYIQPMFCEETQKKSWAKTPFFAMSLPPTSTDGLQRHRLSLYRS